VVIHLITIKESIFKLVSSLLFQVNLANYRSYDYYDWWATGLGGRMKQLAYKSEPYGHLIFTAPILAVEWWFPYLRKPLGIKMKIAPIVVAQHGLACLELYNWTGDEEWLDLAEQDGQILLQLSVLDGDGICWGFPFSWSSNDGVIPPNLPAVSQTSYGFDLFEKLWLLTHKDKYFDYMISIARATSDEYVDLNQLKGLSHSYFGRGIGDIVMNAITYRIHVLAQAIKHGKERYRDKVEGLVTYVISHQQSDGSWYYGESSQNQFIDHYHTAFVIKNLYRANQVLNGVNITTAIEAGLHFYWEYLFYPDGLPRPFAKPPRLNIVRYDSYDFAEALALFPLLGPKYGFTSEKLEPLISTFVSRFCHSDVAIRFREYFLPAFHAYPYYRGGMSASILSLSKLLNSSLLGHARVDF